MSSKKPNVILIISDQWSAKMADGSGEEGKLNTPGLNKMASEGMRFEESYSSFPLCCPARSSIYTGLMPHNNGCIDNEEVIEYVIGERPTTDNFFTDTPTLGEELKKAGYDTGYFGKEHAAGYGWAGIDDYGSMKFSRGGYLAEGSVFDQIFAKDAIDFIKRDRDNPFYLTLSFVNPHDICKTLGDPIAGKNISDALFFCRDDSEKYLYDQERYGLPENFNDEFVMGMIKHKDYMYNELKEWDENYWKTFISTYALLIEKTDWYVDLVMNTLKEQGLDEDTIVIFTTDHGDMMGSHQLIAKTAFYEESAKTPFVIKYPKKIKAGEVNKDAFISSIDIMPTLLDLCELPVPERLDGRSFKDRCFGGVKGNFGGVFSENYYARMYRFGDYKYIRSRVYDENYEILFDMKNDPNETTNIFGTEGYEEVSKKASATMDEWLKEQNLGLEFGIDYIKDYHEKLAQK